jgi:hypothetical protein
VRSNTHLAGEGLNKRASLFTAYGRSFGAGVRHCNPRLLLDDTQEIVSASLASAAHRDVGSRPTPTHRDHAPANAQCIVSESFMKSRTKTSCFFGCARFRRDSVCTALICDVVAAFQRSLTAALRAAPLGFTDRPFAVRVANAQDANTL